MSADVSTVVNNHEDFAESPCGCVHCGLRARADPLARVAGSLTRREPLSPLVAKPGGRAAQGDDTLVTYCSHVPPSERLPAVHSGSADSHDASNQAESSV